MMARRDCYFKDLTHANRTMIL